MDSMTSEQLAILAEEDQGPLTKSLIITFTIISFVCVCLRIFTRIKYMGRAIGWEDHTIVVSMLFSIITAIFQILQANAGNGRHAMFIPFPEGVIRILRYLYWSIIFYNLSLTFTKISILLQYGRIFTVREMRIPLHITMAICIAWGITTILTSIFTCVPVNAYWQILEQAKATCIRNKTIWYVNASINIFTDVIIAVLPVRVIWRLQVPMKQRVALLGILTIGWFVCIVSVLRLHALVVLAAHPDDNTWYSSATAYWSAIESNLAIVCASLPALKPLIVKIIPGFSARHSSRGYGTGVSDRHKSQAFERSTHHTADDTIELDTANIYVTRQVEQHFEENGHGSDSESQKDLVAVPESVLEHR
ncbi:hypothetical protein ACN47E_003220 [Coniothyrium glycines]